MAEGRGDRARRDAWWPNPRTTWLCTFGENIGGANEVKVGHPVGSRSNWMSTIRGLEHGSNPHPESREWRRGSCLATAQRALGAVGCCHVGLLLLCSSRGPANAHGSIKGVAQGQKRKLGASPRLCTQPYTIKILQGKLHGWSMWELQMLDVIDQSELNSV